jgi:hydroxyacylglutathione hydrolase
VEEKLSVTQAWNLVQVDKTKIVDLRGPSDFARGHARGALNLPYSAKGLEERLGLLLKSGIHVILFGETTEQAEGALLQLRGGSFPVAGVIEASMKDWHDNALPVDLLVEVSLAQLSEAVVEGKIVVLDVREPIEWDTGHVPGAILISLGTLKDRLHELPPEAGITVICEAGVRSSAAASILQAAGFIGVANVLEGTGGYRNAGLPLQFPENQQ